MTEQEYLEAPGRINKLQAEIESLQNQMLEYENEHIIPEFFLERDVREFLAFELPPYGKLFAYDNSMWKVISDIDEQIRDYGIESVVDAILEVEFRQLLKGQTIGLIEKIS